jgi:hypothetical protein
MLTARALGGHEPAEVVDLGAPPLHHVLQHRRPPPLLAASAAISLPRISIAEESVRPRAAMPGWLDAVAERGPDRHHSARLQMGVKPPRAA